APAMQLWQAVARRESPSPAADIRSGFCDRSARENGPAQNTALELFHDLTGRPRVDVRERAFADLLLQRSPHGSSSRREEQTPGGGQKRTPPIAAADLADIHVRGDRGASACPCGGIGPFHSVGREGVRAGPDF